MCRVVPLSFSLFILVLVKYSATYYIRTNFPQEFMKKLYPDSYDLVGGLRKSYYFLNLIYSSKSLCVWTVLQRWTADGERLVWREQEFISIYLRLLDRSWGRQAVLEAVRPAMPSGLVRTALLSYIAKRLRVGTALYDSKAVLAHFAIYDNRVVPT
jgi:hypothetical protein